MFSNRYPLIAKRSAAFTLIELIVVIAIIAVLAAIITPNVFRAIEKAKISACIGDIKAIRSASFAFYADTGTLPCTKAGGWGEDPGFTRLITPSNCWANEGGCASGCTNVLGWDGPYLEKWPVAGPWHIGGGGRYNWNRWAGYSPPGIGVSCAMAGIVTMESYGAVPVASLQAIDRILDDNNLTTGYVFVSGNVTNPDYLQFVVTCQ
ncbi:MAG: prepilin-type N-terminal cleavage/methylation domain-containing protein [Candidatus Omnitrophica bacterium]|nr:prepilin-type N-terminal cleavage/methylation domain-containing protein [Candidatus Omnitrophota bacterium]